MSLYSKILQDILLPLGDKFFSSSYRHYVKRYRDISTLSSLELSNIQKDNINKILLNAINNAPYYKNFKELYNTDDPIGSLKKFPILTKDILRAQTSALLTLPAESMIKNSTSGSTGVQTHIYVTKNEQSQFRAIQTVWWEWAGFVMGEPILQTGLATHRTIEKRIKDFFFRTKYVFAFGITKNQLSPLLPWIKKHKPFLGGYASSLYVISQNLEGEGTTFRSAVSWGDKLFDHYKKNIEKNLGCKVFETYGTGEGLMIAAQKDLDYMYILSPAVYIEIVDENGNEVPDGTLGSILVTSLLHKGMPLIRYKPGDLAIKLPIDQYPLKRELNFPLMQKVIGRETDIVTTPSGKKLIVHSFTGIFEYYPEIKQFCVRQSDLHGIQIDFIRGENYNSQILDVIKGKLMHFIAEDFKIEFVEVDHIPSTPSGKPQIIISTLPK